MQDGAEPTPERVFATLQGYQRTAAMGAALELDLFTAIDEGATTAEAIGRRVEASTRGTRILCDYMTVLGFLTKNGDDYALAEDAAARVWPRGGSLEPHRSGSGAVRMACSASSLMTA